jgi:hypothetical protein
MTDATRNPGDRELWPRVTVLAGWVYTSDDEVQMGFALSPSWGPPAGIARRANRASQSLIRRMHLPPVLEWWLLEQFRSRHLNSVDIQRAEGRWRVHLALNVQDFEIGDLVNIVNDLMITADLPTGSDGQRVEELGAITREHPDFTELDALFHWLGDRVKQAIQAIFDAGRG